ncbi:TonB-dependent receptor plug domain-containing protein [Hymenobacter sp. BT188]|uniref:TonB-dependent receptor plug domain-containing protein n=1 Tax=Hymenobacter sp. BT188 TaxID=2763504 RepID=UPI001651936A|nr:TonB-dependent receptor plug domain-containing protein [Hymenobacter sp. BT188]MBC6606144.1 TonB-dependent receptor plug domain-containing protein [Hymenobacter sp. BT188]
MVLVIGGFQVASTDDFVRQAIGRLQNFYIGSFPEKSYIHTDKAFYAVGETIWLKAYIVEASQHRPDTMSKVLYVDLIAPDQRVVAQRVLRLTQGTAAADFELADSLAQGMYTVRAYTNWMRNFSPDYFFSKRLPVWQAAAPATATDARRVAKAITRKAAQAPKPKTDVQFFPEGGNLVAGLPTVVAFKATDEYGRGITVSGQISDDQGQAAGTFKSLHAGMGTVLLTPQPGRQYKAAVVLPGGARAEYPLPAVAASGFVLKVTQTKEFVYVGVQRQTAAGNAPAENVTLLAHVRGNVAYAANGQLTGSEGYAARIPKAKFPTGVAHFTLFDGQGVAQGERLAFIDAQPGLQVRITPDKATYAPREKVNLTVAVTDGAGQPVATQLSLAVTNALATGTNEAPQTTILTHLLLTSDLQGYVENPGYYFQNKNPETDQALDHLMLTQGWRRFVWKEILTDKKPPRPFALEQTLSVGGQVVRPNEKAAGVSQLTIFQAGGRGMTIANTDTDGSFVVGGFQGKDTARVVVQARKERGGSNLLIKLNPRWPEVTALTWPLPAEPQPAVTAYLQQSQKQQKAERQYRADTAKTIMLKGVTVAGRKPAPRPDARRIYGQADVVLRTDDIPGSSSFFSVLQLLQGRVAGVQVSGSAPNFQVQIRGGTSISGSNSPLFVLDGIPVDIDAVNTIPVTDVETVEILKGPSAAIYGSRGAGGVIAIFTKRGNSNYDYSKTPAPGIATAMLPAYYQAREFYAPRYETAARPAQQRPDYRSTTLYWAPTLRTDATGQAQVSFYCSDDASTFRVAVEGLSNAGTPGVGTGEFRVGN